MQVFDIIKSQAWDEFQKAGLPTNRMEDWKYTSLSLYGPLSKIKLTESAAETETQKEELLIAKRWLAQHNLQAEEISSAVIVNGNYCQELSQIPLELKGKILPLTEILNSKNVEFLKPKTRVLGEETRPLQVLNTARMKDGVFIHIPQNFKTKTPLFIIQFNTERESTAHIRNIFRLESHSELEVVLIEVGVDNTIYATNTVCDWHLMEGSVGRCYRLQVESEKSLSLHSVETRLEKESEFEVVTIGGGAQLARSDILVGLYGEKAKTQIYGAIKLGGQQHNDNYVWVDHSSPDCQSDQLFKSIVTQKAKNILSGTIWVQPGAEQTAASQKSQNLLLSNEGEIVIKPRLEIHADDVKCSHGATTGQINKEALFYLRSRGIELGEAQKILAKAFIFEILDKIENPQARQVVEYCLNEKLEGVF